MYVNTYNYFKYFCYNRMVKSNKPLIIKSVKSAMHSLLTPLVLTIFKSNTYSPLCVPASSARVERLFSIAGKIFRPKRCRLMDKRLEELMFIRCNQ